VLHVVARRQPGLEIVLAPCRVQGEGAALEVAAAIRLLNEWHAKQPPAAGLDLILVTRGGGSLEDLWAFNEEIVARAVFLSALPVVSGVGHEVDFTICDFVADVRAATPSAAAEIITEGMYRSRQLLAQTARRLHQLVRLQWQAERDGLKNLAGRLARLHPRRRVQEYLQHLDDLQAALGRRARQRWQAGKTAWQQQAKRLARLKPSAVLARRRSTLVEWARRLRAVLEVVLEQRRNRLAQKRARLELLGPANVLARGYSITLDESTGKLLRSAAETQPGHILRTQLASGEVRSVVRADDDKAGPAK